MSPLTMPQAPAPPDAAPKAANAEASDGALLEAYQGGEADALDRLIRRHQRPLYRMLLRQVRDPAEAEDLTQQVFLKALDRLSGLRDAGAFRSWLFRIALNLCRNRHRHAARWRQATPELLEAQVAPGDDAEASLARQRRWQEVEDAIGDLPRMQREVLRLRLHAEIPFSAIAKILGSSEPSCKVSYHHAVKKLRAALTERKHGS